MRYFRLGQDRQGYSRALREYSKQVSSRYFPLLILRRLGVKKVKTKIVFD